MRDREFSISVHGFIAFWLWVAAVGLLVARWFVDLPPLGATAVVVSVAASTMTVRYFLGVHADLVRTAFQLGRDSGGSSGPRPVH